MKQTQTKMKSWIPVYYAACGIIWILLSDHLLTAFARDVPTYAFIATIKGWIFVAVTAIALYLIVLLEEKRKDRAGDYRKNISRTCLTECYNRADIFNPGWCICSSSFSKSTRSFLATSRCSSEWQHYYP